MLFRSLTFASNNNIFGKTLVLLICTIFICDKRDLVRIWNCFKIIFSISLLLSLSFYVLVTILGIDLPHTVISSLNANKDDTYLLYPFLVRTSSQLFDFNFRFFGLYDEPGVIGTFSSVFLICDNFDFKKKLNIVLLVSGILSMSLPFYAVIFFYILTHVSWKYKILLVSIISIIAVSLYNNEIIYYYVFRRFTFEDGTFVGDNRTIDSFESFYKNFKNGPDYLWGLGAGTSALQNYGGSSYKQIIVDYGFLFFIVYVIALYANGFSITKWKKSIFYGIIIFLVLYQRPFISSIVYVFIIIVSSSVLDTSNLVKHENKIQ